MLHPAVVVPMLVPPGGAGATQIFSFPSGDPSEMADLTEEEGRELGTLRWFYENKDVVQHADGPAAADAVPKEPSWAESFSLGR